VPALPDVPGVFKTQFQFKIGNDPLAICHLFNRYTGAWPIIQADCNTVATTIYNAYATNILIHTSTEVTLNEVLTTDLGNRSSLQGVHQGTTAGTGGVGPMPANIALLLNMKVQRRYRGGKPRVYWPAGSETDLGDAQKWNPASLNTLTGGFITLINAMAALTWPTGASSQLVSVSYYWTPPPTPEVPKPPAQLRQTPVVDNITTWALNPTYGSQRRRLRATGA
jgi:hypothetical protein